RRPIHRWQRAARRAQLGRQRRGRRLVLHDPDAPSLPHLLHRPLRHAAARARRVPIVVARSTMIAMSTPLRRPSATVLVGGVPVGSGHPIVVQSMTNTDTADPDGTAIQVAQLAHAGSELVRITVNNDEAA